MLQIEARKEVIGVHFTEIAELEQPITRILKQIIRDGRKYDLIIGDDTSGRIPTLIIGRVLNAFAQEREQKKIPVRFADRFFETSDEMGKIFEKFSKKPGRALFSTEFIARSYTLQKFGRFFLKQDIVYDVATIGMLEDENFYRDNMCLPDSTMLYFDRDHVVHHTPMVYDRRFLTGLRRNVCIEDRVIRNNRSVRYYATSARKDVSLFSERITDCLRGDK